ncbi:cyclomaltodextrinase N-terminal domain-containing protein [Capnocytophaga canimorsus]|uniref:Cyclomaltodextrinase N-terminal domain-containing protein n=2 Tax=Capnocytophaga canimorsus TaxID=28188 RepID=F9YVH6_CAPCC|nr:cyclomaltodextrinase N-terminal domain-containing protein [Capnocytophaga canimorsus]AEK24410.1 Hypothetical protein Ccan_22950 [Capnocytophaga canimorsus Cc5]ATA91831.1 hypothetical protein CGC56_06405 [Capnocytophaga canimorsus]CEN48577.1 conserved exported hypothetical protein [Capnocytophaga canimorsus]
MKKVIFFLFFTLGLSSIYAQIQRVEPPFWWTDMRHSQLQIMLYGKEIAQFSVVSELPIAH